MATRKSKKKSKSRGVNDENSLNYTLNDSYWMDSFDKLVENVKRPLRERNIFKRNVRVSYNRDSSLENPTTDEEEELNGMMVVASTPRFKSAPKSYSRGTRKTSSNHLLRPPVSSKLSLAKDMFFNFISTPSNRKTDQSLNLSVIVSSEGEGSIWKRVSFPNLSNYLQKKRRSNASPVAGEESRKMLKSPEKEEGTADVEKKGQKKERSTKSRGKGSLQEKGRKSEKPRVLFNLVNEEGDDEHGVAAGRKTENFVLKPGKWRKSIANIRRTVHADGPANDPAKKKQSVMFDVPERDEELRDEGATAGRWTKGPRTSQYHPGRRRKSIFIAPRPDSIIVIDELDGTGHNQSTDELLAHQSDDDRDRGLRKPKSAGLSGPAKGSVDNNRPTRGRSIPVPSVTARASLRQHVDVELVERLAEQLCLLSPGGGGGEAAGERTLRKIARERRDLLNDSSVQLLLHHHSEEEWEEQAAASSSSSCGSVSSDEEVHAPNDPAVVRQTLLGVDDLVVGSKFARQLSKSHSVVVEADSSDIYQLGASLIFEGAKKKKKKSASQVDGDHQQVRIVEASSDEEEEEQWHQPERRINRGKSSKSASVLPESPTRFCFIDGTNQVSVRDTVLRYCDQTEPLRFADVYSERVLRQCRKVGEGVYSEVFMYRQVPPETTGATTTEGKAIVLKVIPIEGALIVNGEVQKKFDEILSEIIISKELSDLRYDGRNRTNGFVNVERVRCVKGRYPSYLVDLWDLYNDNHVSDNDHPEVFGDDQLFIVLELENAGQDLEAFNFSNAVQGHSAFLQTVLTLAVAETKYEFEHRDLHWGNILLRHTEEREATFVLNGQRITVPTEGVQVTIIDYTLSRMLYKRHYLQFNDLGHDEDLFSATGDYQYEIYRLMRKRLGNVWSSFEPYTNVLWLHYMIDKLINGARYRLKQSKKHKTAIKQMMSLRDDVPDYKSAADLVAQLFQC